MLMVLGVYNDLQVPYAATLAFELHEVASNFEVIRSINNPKPLFNFCDVSSECVRSTIRKLDVKKATGPDLIPSKALSIGGNILSSPLAAVFNAVVRTSRFPQDSKHADVVPVFKKDNPLLHKNYRPVSLLSSSSKVLERLMEEQLQERFLPTVYDDRLCAFRSGRSCQHVLLDLTDQWREALDQKLKVGLLLLDLSKAFDCLPHALIAAKMFSYGASAEAVTLIACPSESRE
jgi:hypothetical protein